jgi:hypothetical protein
MESFQKPWARKIQGFFFRRQGAHGKVPAASDERMGAVSRVLTGCMGIA